MLFNKWIADMISKKQLEGAESDDDEANEDEIQIIDSFPLDHGKEKDKEET